ncbi:MAG: hypothetical protein DMG05_16120 [Acidobacteria bacterium]|nr:MAG: hypothetical protein DMG05_16120 [Acidobacteriota bacterium]
MDERKRSLVSLAFVLLFLTGGFNPGQAQEIFKEQRVQPTDFAILSWGPTPAEPQQLHWMKEAGINIAGFVPVKDLAAFQKAGLQVFVADPRVSGYDFEKPLDENLVRRNIQSLAKEIGNNPAVIGFMLRDEPHARAMPSLGVVARLIREIMPGKWPYVNLFPVRVSADRMGVANYTDYVRLLVDTIHQPFLSYDNYSLVKGEMLDSFYTNLEVVRRLSVETEVPFWNCVLSNAHFNYMENTDATYHLQAYATLAHGGRGIQYFSYFTWSIGNYRLGPIDQVGNKTRSWDMLRRVNNEIHALAPTLKKLKSTGVFHFPDVPPECRPLNESQRVRSVEMSQRNVVPPVQGRFLIGEFIDPQGQVYLMLVNKDLNNSFRYQIELKEPNRKLIHVSPYSGQEESFGREMDWVAPGAGHLFRVE